MKKNLLLSILIGVTSMPSTAFGMNVALAIVAKTTSALKATFSIAPFWYNAYQRADLLTEKGKTAYLRKYECQKLPQEVAMEFTNGNPDVEVYYSNGYFEKSGSPAAAYRKTVIVDTFMPGETGWYSLQDAVNDHSSKDFIAYAGTINHETSHAINGDSATKILPYIAIPAATHCVSNYLIKKYMPARMPMSNGRFTARCVGRIPGGLGLWALNTALLAPLHRFHEDRADRYVNPEYVDGSISILKGVKIIGEQQIQQVKKMNIHFGKALEVANAVILPAYHPSLESREKTLLAIKENAKIQHPS
jgi:hypothetical protein